MKRILLIAAVLLAAAVLVLVLGGSDDDGKIKIIPPSTTPTQTSTTPAPTVPKDRRPTIADKDDADKKVKNGAMKFDLPKDAENVSDVSVAGAQEVRFETGDLAARVRVQPASREDSVASLMADYGGQGKVTRATLGSRTGVLVVSPSPPYVSQLFVTVRGGRLYYSQVLSRKNDQRKAKSLLRDLHTSLKVKNR